MDADHRKTRRKISYLRDQKERTEHLSLRETITTPEVTIQAEVVVGAKTKIDLCVAWFTRETQTMTQGIVPSS
jgi:hypothetical protein